MIPPTIGRVLWYHPMNSKPGDQPHAAIVAKVHSDTRVNLACFDDQGEPYSQLNVPLYQGEGERPEYLYAEWMPYQLGQAKKD